MVVQKQNRAIQILRKLNPFFSVDIEVKIFGKTVFHWHFPPESDSISGDVEETLEKMDSFYNDVSDEIQ